jgi:hypothetical protein
MRHLSRAVLTCGVALMVVAPAAFASDTYTLDGAAYSASEALADPPAGGCAASADAGGVIACFSTEAKRAEKVRTDLRANKVPPGFGGMPTQAQKDKLLSPSANIASVHGRKRARAASCDGSTHTHNDYYQQGYFAYFYTTNGWYNFSSATNNQISSDTTSSDYHAYYHDYGDGQGPYFDQAANYCHVDNSLDFDGWDNRFSSYYSW